MGKKFKASKKNQLIWIKDLNVKSETMKSLGKDTGEMFQVDGVDFLDKSPGHKSKNRHRIASNQKLLYCKTNNSDEAAYTGERTGKLVTNKDLTSRVLYRAQRHSW